MYLSISTNASFNTIISFLSYLFVFILATTFSTSSIAEPKSSPYKGAQGKPIIKYNLLFYN